MGKCDLVDYNELTESYNQPPPGFQYFDNEASAYTEQKDYCPTFSMEMANCKEVPGTWLSFLQYAMSFAVSSCVYH
eukprot:scaffold13764_cov207-Alexandrium_tamarense.AAC.2